MIKQFIVEEHQAAICRLAGSGSYRDARTYLSVHILCTPYTDVYNAFASFKVTLTNLDDLNAMGDGLMMWLIGVPQWGDQDLYEAFNTKKGQSPDELQGI